MPKHARVRRLTFGVIILLIAGSVALWIRVRRVANESSSATTISPAEARRLAGELEALEAQENQLDQTIWAPERLAEQCGQLFDSLWDLLNISTNKLDVLAAFPAGQIIPARLGPSQRLPHGIDLRTSSGRAPAWSSDEWRTFLSGQQRGGWQLAQVEFRHNRFETNTAGRAAKSQFYFSAHLTNSLRPMRAALEGDLAVTWDSERTQDNVAVVKEIDASALTLKMRQGPPGFRPILSEQIVPPDQSYFIDPLILSDLDGDGFSEIILAAKNLILRRRAGDRFESEPLSRHFPGLTFTGLIADFDGDGSADFLCAKFEGLMLLKGAPQGVFDQPGRFVWMARPHLKYGQALTCGDIDRDGDLDVWLGQYKVPYERGQMPTPYYDANDGHPAYLLLNDGQGNFSDATIASGLGEKRWRRCYSASFVDLDNDRDLDLAVVSDFAGADFYANDGRGHFKDVTRDWAAETRGFGMSHAVADFDADGRLDFLMIGMNSPTADRLRHLGLIRPARTEYAAANAAMAFGNRLYLTHEGKPFFQQTSLNDSIARSGWSWGCSAADFDNDGFADIYVANGHETKPSVREYEPEFWLHDIYVGNSKEGIVPSAYFGSKATRTRGRGHSYGGYEKNRFYLNQSGKSFVEIGHFMGVALEQDSRNAVADDLDGDGRLDLLVTTFEVWPRVQQTIKVFRNVIEESGNWIGVRLRDHGGATSPVGARITLQHAGGSMTKEIIAGDSFRSQQSNTAHFGLGKIAQAERIEIRWLNGATKQLHQPALNQYHNVQAKQ